MSHRAIAAIVIFLICAASAAWAAGPAPTPDAAEVDARRLIATWVKPPGVDRAAAEVAIQTEASSRTLTFLDAASSRHDLPEDARRWLKALVDRERPRDAARAKVQQRVDTYNEWNVRTALEQFEKVGKHDPKWDAAAREGILAYVSLPKNDAKAYEVLGRAVALGCDDPFVLYLHARGMESFAEREKADEQLQVAATALEGSQYPAVRKELAALRAFEHFFAMTQERYWKDHTLPPDLYPRMDRLTKSFADAFVAMAAEEGVPEYVLEDTATRIVDIRVWPGMDRKKFLDVVMPPLEKALPKSAVPLYVKGKFYIGYAWDGRGSGWANTVTAEGWRQFGNRLAEAQKALEAAWAMDPTRAEVAEAMITVALGTGWPREQMETWFGRAMALNPDDYAACTAKLFYLEPKWHGSAEAMLAFGRECLASGNWRGDIPFVLLDAHRALAAYQNDADEYWSQPAVWADIQAIYGPFLKAHQESWYARSAYCFYACRGGHWDVAAREFELLGDHAVAKQFGGVEKLAKFREEAKKHAGEAN